MAPNGEVLVGSYARKSNNFNKPQKPRRISMEGLQRAISDLSFEMSKEAADVKLPPISEVEMARCECCGMSEECTPEYISRVRDKFCGRWICGLCTEAVKEEAEKAGGRRPEEALEAHMSACVRFNRIGRTNPVLFQAEAMKEILKKSREPRAKSISPKDQKAGEVKRGSIARSSSCIPAITREVNEKALAK